MSIVQSDRITDVLAKLTEARKMTAEIQAHWRPEYERRKLEVNNANWHRWRVDKPETYKAGYHATYVRRRTQSELTDVTAATIREIRHTTKQCHYCATPLVYETVTIDHVIPLSKGGAHMRGNLVGCCQPCNSRKAGKLNWKP